MFQSFGRLTATETAFSARFAGAYIWRLPMTIKEGEYHIVRDSRQTSYPFDVMRRLNGRDYRINSFKTEIHARYFAAAQNIAASQGGDA